jgi:hypothetical protein
MPVNVLAKMKIEQMRYRGAVRMHGTKIVPHKSERAVALILEESPPDMYQTKSSWDVCSISK